MTSIKELPKTNMFIDPALYTFDEYKKIAGMKIDEYGDEYYHRSGAYSSTLAELNQYPKDDYSRLISNIKKKGIDFVVKAQVVDYMQKPWFKYESNHKPIIINGVHQQLTQEEKELALKGKERYLYHFAIFNEQNECVALTQEEYGCLLVRVAAEYKGFGLGPYLVGLHRKYFPDADSGGFTVPGINNLLKVHTQFVKDYLASGKYSKLVKDKVLTIDKVKEITKYVDKVPTKSNLASDTPIMSGKVQIFHEDTKSAEWVVYDEAISELMEKADTHQSIDYWVEKCLLACHYNEPIYRNKKLRSILRFGKYKNENVKLHMVKLACSYDIHKNGITEFIIPKDELSSVESLFENTKQSDSSTVISKFKSEYIIEDDILDALSKREQSFRKTFDKYDEFKTKLWELGASEIK